MQQGSRQGAPPGLPLGQADRLNRGDNGENKPTPGLVRNAREAIEAGQAAEQRSRGRDADSRMRTPAGAQSSAPRNKLPVPPAIANGRGNPGAIGAAISRPAPMSQWPLADNRM